MQEDMRRPPGRPRLSDVNSPTIDIILQQSTGMFMEQGFEGVSISGIAKSCRVTKATIYYYFDTKAELFTEGTVRLFDRIRNQVSRILSQSMPLKDRMTMMAERYVKSAAKMDFDTLMREAEPHLTAGQLKRMKEAEGSLHQIIAEEFKKAIDSGEIKLSNPLLASYIFVSSLRPGMKGHQSDLFDPSENAVKEIIDLLWSGFLPRSST